MLMQQPGDVKKLTAVPTLREDLKLYPGTKTKDGFPSWIVYDPPNNRYYRIGWEEFEMLSRWHLQNIDLIIKAVNSETTLKIAFEDVKKVIDFLTANNLIYHDPNKADSILYGKKLQAKMSLFKKFLTGYLFFRIPLWKPDKFLTATEFLITLFINRKTLYVLGGMILLSLYLLIRQWEQFISTFMYFFNPKGMLFYAIAITVVQIFHELSHAYTAHHYGCRVHTIGIAFIVLWPVLYTDTSDSWRLTSRRKQIAINSAGVVSELLLATFAIIVWSFLDSGILKSICFITATASLAVTLSINLNPLMRFDGYYLLADAWDIDNLQGSSVALGKWQLRKWLFNLDEPPPAQFSARNQFLLILFAYATWIYRFLLYLGIALLVYHLFFKLLGIILMLLEIILLLVAPIWRELQVYYKMRSAIKLRKINLIPASLLAATLILLIIPWQNTEYVPALLRLHKESHLYAPEAAMIQSISAKEGATVRAGEVLMQLDSYKLEHELKLTTLDIEMLHNKIRQDLQLRERLGDKIATEKELADLLSKQQALLDKKQALTVIAPFDGKIVEINDQIHLNSWIAPDEFLIEIINDNNTYIEAYVEEHELNFIAINRLGKFVSEDFTISSPAKIKEIDKISTKVFTQPYLASIFGGDIPVLKNDKNEIVPATAIYRVLLQPQQPLAIKAVTPGTIGLAKKSRSILARMWNAVSYIVIRESGF